MRHVIASLAIVVSTAAQAETSFYCTLTAESRFGWIPENLGMRYDETTNMATVFDNAIKTYVGKPIAADLKRRDAKSLQLDWTVGGIELSNANRKVSADYSVNFWPDTGRVTMQVYLKGFDMLPPKGSGTCKQMAWRDR